MCLTAAPTNVVEAAALFFFLEIPGQARNEERGGGRNGYDRPFDGLRDRSSTPGMALMEQVPFGLGAGSPTSWRRWPQFLEQVWKKGVNLRQQNA